MITSRDHQIPYYFIALPGALISILVELLLLLPLKCNQQWPPKSLLLIERMHYPDTMEMYRRGRQAEHAPPPLLSAEIENTFGIQCQLYWIRWSQKTQSIGLAQCQMRATSLCRIRIRTFPHSHMGRRTQTPPASLFCTFLFCKWHPYRSDYCKLTFRYKIKTYLG